MVLMILQRGISFSEIYLLGRFKPNKISCEYFHVSKWNDMTYTISRRNKNGNEHFGNRIESKHHTNIIINDHKNLKLPEEPTTCCMSGCANCVWLEYAEKLSEFFNDGGEKAIQEINDKVNDPNIRAFLLQELRMKKLY